MKITDGPSRKPAWLKTRLRTGENFRRVNDLLQYHGLNTVCQSANCPNRHECFSRGTATFLILGPNCTRNCGFCDVTPGPPAAVDPAEPIRVAGAAGELNLKHVVVTSVTRDDLPDSGAGQFAAVIAELRAQLPGCTIEVLTPDFRNNDKSLAVVIEAGPDIFNHNLETVERLYPRVRPGADYGRSLRLLERAGRCFDVTTKSGLMVGLGETREELHRVFDHLALSGVTYLTIGQYLPPSPNHLPVERYVTPALLDAKYASG